MLRFQFFGKLIVTVATATFGDLSVTARNMPRWNRLGEGRSDTLKLSDRRGQERLMQREDSGALHLIIREMGTIQGLR